MKGALERKAMARDKLILFKRLQEYKKTKGKMTVYDYATALRPIQPHNEKQTNYKFMKDPIVEEICERRGWGSIELAIIMAEIPLRIKKRGLKILEPEDDPCGVAWIGDEFGDVKQCLTSARFGQVLISPKLWFPITKPY